jgi:cobyrinic acid a,c-diamide synthase
LIVGAAASHSGKTTISVGLIAALGARGMQVRAAKCGPDYIDPKFLEAASGTAAINLDPWAMRLEVIATRLDRQAEGADIVIVEGVMGLYDGGRDGIGSTASLARLSGLPVLLVVGGHGLAQTAAAVAEGCARLADGFSIVGAIANQIASERHADLVREGFRRASVPLLGLVRRDPSISLPSRHLGLVQAEEHEDLVRKIARAGELVAEGCDLELMIDAAGSLPPCGGEAERGQGHRIGAVELMRGGLHLSPLPNPPGSANATAGAPPHMSAVAHRAKAEGGRGLAPLGHRIAVAKDVAFAFAYPHLLSDWRDLGAEISFFSPLADEAPSPDADAVFLPGGYPELHAGRIAAASNFRAGMVAAAERGTLVYGECGGYMVLGENLIDAEGADHPMLGLLPLATSFRHRMLHLGYRLLRPLGDLPWYIPLSAHEFHFARIVSEGDGDPLFEAESAAGMPLGPIGLRRGRVMGSFAHVIDAA